MSDKEKRDKAVDEFAKEMKARLDWAAEVKGHTGWDGEYPSDSLRGEIFFDAESLDGKESDVKVVDIANRCMMLWYRRQRTCSSTSVRQTPEGG